VLRGKLDALLALAEATDCRRVRLLGYFGEPSPALRQLRQLPAPARGVGRHRGGAHAAVTIYRVQQASGISFGAGHIMDILRGKATEKVASSGTRSCQHLRHRRGVLRAAMRGVLRQLIARNMVRVDAEAFSTLQLMPDARQVLKGEVSVVLREQAAGAKAAAAASA
jgi:ATP-dependent DNA helicase RecQ